jgi:hypothetical protein
MMAENYGLHSPFLLTSAGMAAASLYAAARLPETSRAIIAASAASPETSSKSGAAAPDVSAAKAETGQSALLGAVAQWRVLLKAAPMQGITAVTFMTGVAQGASPVTTILFATEHLGMTTGELGIMFTAVVLSMAAVVKPATTLSDRLKQCRSAIMIPGFVISACALAVQPMCTTVAPFVSLAIMRAVCDAACVMPNVSPFIIDNSTEEHRAQALAMRNMGQDVGILFGSVSMGLLSQMADVPTAMVTTAALQASVAGFFWLKTRGPQA